MVRDIIAALKEKTIAGALAIESGSVDACLDIVHASKGDKCVSMASFPISFKGMAKGAGAGSEMLRQLPKLILFNLTTQIKSRSRGIRTGLIFGTTLMNNEVSRVIYVDFLPTALADGRYLAAPPPLVVGRGLASIQSAFEAQIKGVSARKIVVSL